LYPTGCDDFFTQESISEVLKSVLFVWCKLNKDTSYRQGMHELAAPILYCLYQDASQGLGDDEDQTAEDAQIKRILSSTMSMSHLEADLFWILERMMRDMKPLFIVTQAKMTEKEIAKAKSELVKKNRMEEISGRKADRGIPIVDSETPILTLSHQVQYVLLQQVDGALHNHLKKLDIQPQLYALRWMRLLFGREFHIDQTMVLWDSLFLEGFNVLRHWETTKVDVKNTVQAAMRSPENNSYELRGLPVTAAYFAVAMLTYIRNDLLVDDYCTVLQYLMKYPAVENAHIFVHLAFNLRNSLSDSDAKIYVKELGRGRAGVPTCTQKAETSQSKKEPDVSLPKSESAFARINQGVEKIPVSEIINSETVDERAGRLHMRKGSTSPLGNFFKDLGEKIEHIFEGDDEKGAPKLPQTKNLQSLQVRMGQQLSTIVQKMEESLTDDNNQVDLLGELARIKQVRDILLGRADESVLWKT